jgi:hypothetical protein
MQLGVSKVVCQLCPCGTVGVVTACLLDDPRSTPGKATFYAFHDVQTTSLGT